MKSDSSKVTGSLVVQGVLAILFGIAAVFWPELTLKTLVYLFGAFILIAGLFELIGSLTRIGDGRLSVLTRVVSPLIGLLEIGVGVYLLRHPLVTFATFILLIGFTLIIRGVLEVVRGLFEEGPSLYRIVMIMVGILAVLVGIFVLFQPAASGVAFVWVLGLYSLITGPLLIAAAHDLKSVERGSKR